MAARFVVGIDLGTTHTVVAFVELDATRKTAQGTPPRIFEIDQRTTAHERDTLALLPSCLYAPLPGEVDGAPGEWLVGEFARLRGVEVAGRSITSPKSWLSHGSVDRNAPILPWGTDVEGVERMSPVDASARILSHVRDAWDRDLPDATLADQEVVLTVPASFDEVARELTLKAASQAGLSPVLLEEPTAAFYALMRSERAIRELVSKDTALEEASVLVCDVGGGTTDLSLMAVSKAKSPPWFSVRRLAVGRHILLGGDNMDLALAHVASSRMEADGRGRLEAHEITQLVSACRHAKERIFSESLPEARVTLLGRGGKLLGGARSTVLTRDDVDRVVVDGFFSSATDAPTGARTGLVSFGLPYERDPSITRHVRHFLERHARELPRGVPDAVLLNGGVFNAEPLVAALLHSLRADGKASPKPLLGTEPDLAVARGAVLYGLARRGVGVRIESGASHGYYVALGGAPKEQVNAVCIVPRGATEGVPFDAGQRFELLVGRQVKFELFASDVARDEAGAMVTMTGDAFFRLPPLVVALTASSGEETVPVHLGGRLAETGQIEIACTEIGPHARTHRLAFDMHGVDTRGASKAPPPTSPDARLTEAWVHVDRVFGKKGDVDERVAKDLVRELERVLGERATWTMATSRALVDRLLLNTGARRRSATHERVYWSLLGYGLRPGFGDIADPSRIARVFPMLEGRLAFPDEARGWTQFFIAWRRVAGGLTESMQCALRDAFDSVLAPPEANVKKPKRMPLAVEELPSMLSALERVPTSRRVLLGEWLCQRARVAKKEPRLWEAVGRIGARVPLYASAHYVVPVATAEAWLSSLLRERWDSVSTASYAAVQLARMTGDRARDVSPALRAEVQKRLEALGARPSWIASVREVVDVGEDERAAILGDGLPLGLRLSDAALASFNSAQ
jgi:molecular chaperone DnaK (HSP70)